MKVLFYTQISLLAVAALMNLSNNAQAFVPQHASCSSPFTTTSRIVADQHHQKSRLFLSTKVEEAEKAMRETLNGKNTLNKEEEDAALLMDLTSNNDEVVGYDADAEFKKGFAIISVITLMNSSLSPVWHAVFDTANSPPPLFLNAVVSLVAFIGLVGGGPFLDGALESNGRLKENDGGEKWSAQSFRGGMELGLWKGLGTTCHIFGMSLTTANHGAFLLQLTTLIVPVLQGLRGAEKIPRQIQVAVALALAGIFLFTQDPTKASEVIGDPAMMQLGDGLVLGAAFFYSLYDIQTFYWGREVPRTELVTIKVGFQAILSITLCAIGARTEIMEYLANGPEWNVFVPTVLWSGLIVNALATFLQVGGMQAVGPTRAQTIFASQPLWASIMNYFLLGSVMGLQGFVGGGSFLGALFLAATAEAPLPTTGEEEEAAAEA